MALAIKSKELTFPRNLFLAALGALLVYLFYLSYSSWGVEPALWPDWGEDHPFWRAWGHAAFVFLFLALILGPAAKLWPPLARFLSWRRHLGIWFAVLSVGHAYAIWDRWARWEVAGLFGIQYIEELGGYVLVRPEVGIMNMMMLVIAPMVVLLAATSSDRAVRLLGPSSWKWLHSSLVNVIFYFFMLRGILYFFFFFQFSPPNWREYPSIWFLYVFLGMGLFAVSLQAAAFAKTVLQRSARQKENSTLQVASVVGVAALFVMPLALATGTVAYFDTLLVKENPARAVQAQPTGNYAQTFHMVIHAGREDVHLWMRDADREPYFRETIEVAGSPVSHQIYRFSEGTLYSAELDSGGELTWSKMQNVGLVEIGLSGVATGPGAWAAQYGTREHLVPIGEGMLPVTIHSVGEVIADEIFRIPEGADPVPMTP